MRRVEGRGDGLAGTMRLTGAQAIVQSLMRQGVDTVFALPGGQLDHLFDAIAQAGDKIRLIHSRHEQGAAYMAYGYAKSTGRVGVCAVVPGPGLLNASAALCTAWANYAPVLCIVGQVPSPAIGKGYGELHEIPDQLGMIAQIAKWTHSIRTPEAAPAVLAEAFLRLATGCPRPVVLEMPMDVMGREAEVALCPSAQPDIGPTAAAAAPDEALLDEAAGRLMRAKRPLIYLGSGAIGARVPLRALAERLQAPVVALRGGKGILPADHPLSANFPLGHALWAEADLALAVGTRLHWPLTQWGKDDDLALLRVDIDAEQVNRICIPEVGVAGDAQQVATALLERLQAANFRAASRHQALAALRTRVDAEMRRAIAPLMAYLDVIRACLPRDGFFVDEVTQVGFASWYGFPVYQPRQHVSAGYQGTLGFGYATALGVVAANPGRRVVQISGDGGILYNIQELATAVQHGLPLVTIIFNDNRYTNVQRQQKEWFGGRLIASDLHNPDFVRLAQSFGAAGFHARSPQELRTAMREAFDAPGPSIIEVRVEAFFPSPWPFLMMPQNRQAVCA